jgi:hypothetical protein
MKIRSTFFFPTFAAILLLSGCSEDKPKQVTDVQIVKENAIEVVAKTVRLSDGRFVVHLHKSLFHKGQLLSVDTLRDTLPDLGMETVSIEDENGKKSQQTVPVQYNMLFKVDSLKD